MDQPRARMRLEGAAVFVYLALGALFSAGPRYVTEELGGSRAVAGFSVSIFFLTAIVTRPIVGRLLDRSGRRPFVVVPPFLLAALMLALHGAHWVPVVLVIRAVQGIAGSAFYVAAVTMSTDLSPPDRRASAVARLSIAIYLGFAVGPALGEVLVDLGTGWAWTVLGGVLVVGGLVAVTLPETRPAPTRPGPTRPGPADGDVTAVVAASAPGVAGGPAGTARFLHPAAVLPGLALLGLGVAYASITAHSALYARSIGLDSSGLLYATFAISILVVRLFSGRVADEVGPARVMAPGTASVALGAGVLAVFALPLTAVIGVALIGIGWAIVFPAVTAWLALSVADDERGGALGSLIAFMDVGQAAGGYLVGAVADRAGFGWGYAVPALLCTGSTVLLGSLARRGPRLR